MRDGPGNLQPIPHGRIRSVLGHVALLGLSAVLLGGAFPEPGWWPMIWVALVPAGILAARTASLRRLAWTSYLIFLAWWLVRVSWLYGVTPGGWIGAAAALAVYWTIAVVAAAFLHRRFPLPMTVLLPLAWVGMEFVRSQFPLGGLGWFQIGHAVGPYDADHAAGRYAQLADLFGEWGVSLVVAMNNGLIVDLLVRQWYRPWRAGDPRWSARLRKTTRGVLILWAFVMSAGWFYGDFQIAQHRELTYPALEVAVVQTAVPQSNKNSPTPEEDRRRWRELIDRTREVASREPRPELIAWPETMTPAALNREAAMYYRSIAESWRGTSWDEIRGGPDETKFAEIATEWGVKVEDFPRELVRWYDEKAGMADQVAALADELGVAILAGAPADELPNEGRANSAYLVDPASPGEPRRYDKIHIVPFGEYIPIVRSVGFLKSLFLDHLSPYGFDYSLTPGSEFFAFAILVPPHDGNARSPTSIRFGVPICFEDAVPSACRTMIYGPDGKEKVGDLLVNITNDGWFAGSAQPCQHLQIAAFRSIENRVPTVRAVNVAVSGHIDSVGRIVATLPPNEPAAAAYEVRLDRRRSLFGFVGRWPISLLTLAAGGLVVYGLFRRDRLPADV